MKIAVVGHIEWAKFVHVSRVPLAGEIIHTSDSWQEVAGGGSVAAMQIAKLAGNCMFFTAVGDDELGRLAVEQLKKNNVEVYASVIKGAATRDIFVYIDNENERTITVSGDLKPSGHDSNLPWDKLSEAEAVYFVCGDHQALIAARKARTLISTSRILPSLKDSKIQLDALVCSKKDAGERYLAGELSPSPKIVIITDGINGGSVDNGQTYQAETVPSSKFIDTYGCGDSFAAGLSYAFAQNKDLNESLSFAAHIGAQASMRRGSFGNK